MADLGERHMIIPPGDDKPRSVCRDCGHIDYRNPKPVTGLLAVFNDKVLLCTRAIEPRKGYWTLPAGFQEVGETLREGALREAWEEALAKGALDEARQEVAIGPLLGIYEIPHAANTVHIYQAYLKSDRLIGPGPESDDARLFAWHEIPWNDLAFSMVGAALRYWQQTKGRTDFAPDQQVLPLRTGGSSGPAP